MKFKFTPAHSSVVKTNITFLTVKQIISYNKTKVGQLKYIYWRMCSYSTIKRVHLDESHGQKDYLEHCISVL